ncbi:MAG TPA: glucokinase [Longimicrobiaceae bacterium]|nr:glucokinase [Longimicrobiaceae bacterium]
MHSLLLAGDVGGTKTVLALVTPSGGGVRVVAEAQFENRGYASLAEIVAEFLAGHRAAGVSRASFSVAGPVIGGGVTLSNLSWPEVDEQAFAAELGFESVRLVNDLQATAYALPFLSSGHLLTLQPGRGEALAARAVIAPGTGLGEAFLVPAGNGFHAFPSEGGHADFAPADALQGELCRYLLDREGRVSVEDVCSGRGIPTLYGFLRGRPGAREPAWLADELAAAADPTPVIVEAALDTTRPAPLCVETLRLFASILASEAGNLALRTLATGGVYLGGGIPPRILPVLRGDEFVAGFRRKARLTELLSEIPLHVVLEPRTALFGAARYGFDLASAVRPPTPAPLGVALP